MNSSTNWPDRGQPARIKPGDRCRIVRPAVGVGATQHNLGQIVLVVAPYTRGQIVGGVNDWIADSEDGGRHWIVMSLSGGLLSQKVVNSQPHGEPCRVMSMPIAAQRLAPLRSEEGGIEQANRQKSRPMARRKIMKKTAQIAPTISA